MCQKPDDVYVADDRFLVAGAAARVACSLFAGKATLFGGLSEGHVATVDPQNAATVDGTLETAQCAVDGLVIPYFDTYRHVRSLLEWLIVFQTASKYTAIRPLIAKTEYSRMVPKLLVSTRNAHKLREITAIMEPLGVELVSLNAFPDAPEVDEDRPSLEGNAAKKAEQLHVFTGLPTLADDTGLEVMALEGAPGVRSARFAGEDADDAANRTLLLERLRDADDRRAQFRTVIALTNSEGTRLFEGICAGTIIQNERGDGGFGYDPIFQPDGQDRTFAEMPADAKNRISHRGRALQAFAEKFEASWLQHSMDGDTV